MTERHHDETTNPGPGWTRVVVASCSRALVMLVVSLVTWSLLPLLAGWSPSVVVSGSMAPRIDVGDVLVTRPVEPEALAPGQVLVVADPTQPGRQVAHRLVRIREDGLLVLRGDANADEDSTPVRPQDVRGAGALVVPRIGVPSVWLAEGRLVPLGLLSSLLVLAGACCRLDRTRPGRHRGAPTAPSTDPAEDPPAPVIGAGGWWRRAGTVTGVALVCVLPAAVPDAHVDAAYASQAANPASSFVAAASFAQAP